MTRLLAALAILVAGGVCSMPPQRPRWEMTSFTDFVKGKFDGVSLGRDGRLSLAPKLDTLFTSEQPVIWSVAAAPDGALYAATGIAAASSASNRTEHRSWSGRPTGPRSSPSRSTKPASLYAATFAGRKNLSHRKRQGDGILRSENEIHLVARARARWDALRGHRRRRPGLPHHRAGHGRKYYSTGQGNVTGLMIDQRRAGCSRARSRTASSTASRRRTKPSRFTTRTCRKSAPSRRTPMAVSMRWRWADRWRRRCRARNSIRPGSSIQRRPSPPASPSRPMPGAISSPRRPTPAKRRRLQRLRPPSRPQRRSPPIPLPSKRAPSIASMPTTPSTRSGVRKRKTFTIFCPARMASSTSAPMPAAAFTG